MTPQETAAYYKYDADRLYFEYNRRAFGSFTTTLDGARAERDRYWEAWKIAVATTRTTKELILVSAPKG